MGEDSKKTWKAFPLSWDEISLNDNTVDKKRPLTELQSAILLAAIEHYRWPTRWVDLAIDANELEKQIAEIKDRLMREEECVIDCDEVEACIVDSPTIDVIENDIGGVSAGGFKASSPTKALQDATLYSQYIAADIVNPVSACNDSDKGKLWAAIVNTVFYAHSQNVSFLAAMQGASSQSDGLSKMLLLIPMAGGLASAAALSLSNAIIGTFQASYTASVTNTFLYGVCADIFCSISDCKYGIHDLMDLCQSRAGGTYAAAVSTFLDICDTLTGQTTGGGIFYAMTWLQFHIGALAEKFQAAYSIQNMCLLASSQQEDGGWKIWANACYTPSGAWQIILDWANDWVVTGSEIVIRNPLSLLVQQAGVASTLTQAYARGLIFTNTGSQNVTKDINIGGAGGTANMRVYGRKVSGTASVVQITNTSDTYTGQPARTWSSSTFSWSTAVPLFNVGGSAGDIARIRSAWATQLASQTCVAEFKYFEINGTGDLPTFP